jgi:hypothetical protein
VDDAGARRAGGAGEQARPGGGGPGEGEPLGVGRVDVGERLEVGEVLDPLAADRGAGVGGERGERLEQREAGGIGVGAADEGAVDLEDVRRDADQLLEAGVPGAGVVERDPRAAGAQLAEAEVEQVLGAEQLVLRELDHDPREVLGQCGLDGLGQQREG